MYLLVVRFHPIVQLPKRLGNNRIDKGCMMDGRDNQRLRLSRVEFLERLQELRNAAAELGLERTLAFLSYAYCEAHMANGSEEPSNVQNLMR